MYSISQQDEKDDADDTEEEDDKHVWLSLSTLFLPQKKRLSPIQDAFTWMKLAGYI